MWNFLINADLNKMIDLMPKWGCLSFILNLHLGICKFRHVQERVRAIAKVSQRWWDQGREEWLWTQSSPGLLTHVMHRRASIASSMQSEPQAEKNGRAGPALYAYCLGGGLVAKLCPTLVTPWTVAHQAALSTGFPRQEYWSELLFPSPGCLPDTGIEMGLLHCSGLFIGWDTMEVLLPVVIQSLHCILLFATP